MNTLQKFILGVVAVATVVIGVHAYAHKGLGDATVSNYPTWYYSGIVIGPANKIVNNLVTGTCTLTGATSLATGTSELLTCPAVGAKVGDTAMVTSPTAAVTGGGQGFTAAAASVLANDVLTVAIENNTGSTQTPAAAALSGIQFLITR